MPPWSILQYFWPSLKLLINFVIKSIVLYIFERPFYTGLTVCVKSFFRPACIPIGQHTCMSRTMRYCILYVCKKQMLRRAVTNVHCLLVCTHYFKPDLPGCTTRLDKQIFVCTIVNIFLPISFNICFGAQKIVSSKYPSTIMFWLRKTFWFTLFQT